MSKEKKTSFFGKNKESENVRRDTLKDFSEKFGKYFSTEPEKQRVLRYEDFDAAGDTYYATVSAWYKVLQRVFVLCLALFSVISVAVNFKNITYDNLFYLIKDFGTAVDTESVNYQTISYDASSEPCFTLYRGGLAVAGRSNVSAFTATGRRTLNSNDTYSKPFSAASDKYLLVYDVGQGGFSIYNSFAKVYTERLDYPVTGVSFSKKGNFALLTRSSEYESDIIVYNDAFERVVSFKKGSYALGVSMSEDGELLGAVYCDTESGIVCTKVVFYDVEKGEKLYEYTYTGEFALGCTFLDGGFFAAISDARVRIYDKRQAPKLESEEYSAENVSAISLSGEYAAVSFNDGMISDENRVLVFDKKGEAVYDGTVLSQVEQLSVCDGAIFIKNGEGVLRVRIKDSFAEQIASGDGKMLIYDRTTALVCSDAKAVYLKFED